MVLRCVAGGDTRTGDPVLIIVYMISIIINTASQVELSHMYVDNAAMQLIRNPKQATLLNIYNLYHYTIIAISLLCS